METKNIMFVDIRGFTGWLSRVGLANKAASQLIAHLYDHIKPCFEYTKFLGDGAMVFLPGQTTESGSKEDLRNLLQIIKRTSLAFDKRKSEVSRGFGYDCDSLRLGFGIAKGPCSVIEVADLGVREYVGERINLAARLCSLARPYGIVIDRESFRSVPEEYEDEFIEREVKKISGFSERRVWTSLSVQIEDGRESLDSAERTIEVHVTGLCVHRGKLLLARRSAKRDIYPGMWAGPGGRVKKSESFEEAVRRKFREEVGVDVNDMHLLTDYFVETHRIPGLIFRCAVDSGVPRLMSEENDELRFFGSDELDDIDVVPGLRSFAKRVLSKGRRASC